MRHHELSGCPDLAHLWSDLVTTHLQPPSYGVIVVDCLGYAASSEPADTASYALVLKSIDLCEVLDAEGLANSPAISAGFGAKVLTPRGRGSHGHRGLFPGSANPSIS